MDQEPKEQYGIRWRKWRSKVHDWIKSKTLNDDDEWIEIFESRKCEIDYLARCAMNEVEKNKLAIAERKLGAVTILTTQNLLNKGRIWSKVMKIAEKGFDRFMDEDADFLFQHSQQFDTFVNAMKKVGTDQAQTEVLLRDMPKDHRDTLLDEFDALKEGIQLPDGVVNAARKKVSDETTGFNKSEAKARRGFEAKETAGGEAREGDGWDSTLEAEHEINETPEGRMAADRDTKEEIEAHKSILTDEKRKRLDAIIQERENQEPFLSVTKSTKIVRDEATNTRKARQAVNDFRRKCNRQQ